MTKYILLFFLLVSPACSLKQEHANTAINNTAQALQYIGNGVCLDIRTGNMWQIDKSRKYSSPKQAEKYVKDLQLAGYNDWRLPTRSELLTLHNIFFRHLNGDCNLEPTGNYWVTGEDEEISPGHWETDHLCGPEFIYFRSYDKKGFVRAVRQKK